MADPRVQFDGFDRLHVALTRLANKARKDTKKQILVGFEAEYAVYVHENLEMKLAGEKRPKGHRGVYWGRPYAPGQSKFLETPAKRYKKKIAKRVADVTRRTHSLERGMYSGGVMLRDYAVKLVPVDTGDLKDSAFVEVV